MKHFNITVSGLVQGVYFRASTKEQAEQLGITGFVKNQVNGNVYLEAEGEPEAMKEFLGWLERGPSNARVDNVDSEEGEVRGFTGFEISH